MRRLCALYPDVRCRILYQRDYLNLLLKYGLEEPSQGTLLGERNGPPAAEGWLLDRTELG